MPFPFDEHGVNGKSGSNFSPVVIWVEFARAGG